MEANPRAARARLIREAAEALGFDLVRITNAEPLPAARRAIEERVALGFFEGMDWFTAERAAVSTDPRALLPTAQSVIALGTFYLTDAPRDLTVPGDPHGQISCYAWGDDYHDVIKARLRQLAARIQRIAADESGDDLAGATRIFVDTGRMVDRAVAERSGLGWFGKHTNILTRDWGSWLFLSEIVTTLDLEPDAAIAANCGHCTTCITACPTGAIVAPQVLDARRCISYLTIEHRGAIPLELRPLMGNLIYGCDICQQVCPVNHIVERRLRARDALGPGSAGETRRAMFVARPDVGASPALLPLLDLDEAGFREQFRHSPILRAKRRGLLRNVCVALGNLGDAVAVPRLARTLRSEPEALVRGHAAWALGMLGGPVAEEALMAASVREAVPEVLGEIGFALALLADQAESV